MLLKILFELLIFCMFFKAWQIPSTYLVFSSLFCFAYYLVAYACAHELLVLQEIKRREDAVASGKYDLWESAVIILHIFSLTC